MRLLEDAPLRLKQMPKRAPGAYDAPFLTTPEDYARLLADVADNPGEMHERLRARRPPAGVAPAIAQLCGRLHDRLVRM